LNQHYDTPLEDLLVKYLLQEAGPEERLTVDRWLAADPANQHHFDQLRLIWEKSLQASLPDVHGEEEQAWQTLRKNLQRPDRRHTLLRTLPWIAAAAAAALIFFWWRRPDPAQWQTTASADQIRIDTLTDGSLVTLNKHSSLSRPPAFDTKERTVTLEGEAFFRIAPDKDRPFHIHTNGIAITVLGTSFNVRTQNKKTVIVVETGLIEIQNNRGSVQLQAGETITLEQNDNTLQKQPAAAVLYKYYRPRDFVCHNTPLGDLVDALNQAYGDSIRVDNPALRGLPITTTFHNEPLDTILTVVGATLNIKIHYSDSRYILK
jgi:transmembrane sensor